MQWCILQQFINPKKMTMIKKLGFFVTTILMMQSLFAQKTGIQFINGKNWSEVLALAKKENKYIFVDCYTTWCGPCKYMSGTLFHD
jgi:thiol-disulfide isomerase/thioredoxin